MSDTALADDRRLTIEAAAAAPFEPMSADDLETCKPPKNEEWAMLASWHLPMLRLAWTVLGKTKPELVQMVKEDFDNEVGVELLNQLDDAISTLHQAHFLMEKARIRILVAASVLEVEKAGAA